MKIVGLKIEKGLVAAAVVQKGLRQTELMDSFSAPFATDAELIEILKEKAKDWGGARIVSSIPGYLFSQRVVHLPFADRKRVEKALPFELEDNVPFAFDDIVLDHIALDGGKSGKDSDGQTETPVLAIMLPQAVLRQHLELLSAAGIDPQVIVPSYIGLNAVSPMIKSDRNSLLVCGRDLCVRNGETVKALRSFAPATATGGLQHTLQALETDHKERVEKALILGSDDVVQSALAGIGIAVEQSAPEFHGKQAADAVSLGLAFSDQVNFRKGEFAYRRADEGMRRRRRTVIIAGAAAALLLATNIGVKYYVIESSYGRLDRAIKEIYRQTFPDARLAGDPAQLMRSKFDEAKKRLGALGTGTSALEVMKALTEGIPKEVRVLFQEFTLEGDRVKLQGEASSFEAVDKIKSELTKEKPFAVVTVQDTRMGVDNKVKFRIEIKLKQAI